MIAIQKILPVESLKRLGSSRLGFLLEFQIWVPALGHRPEFLVRRFDPHLQQQMRTPLGPLHLLLCAATFTDDLVDRRFNKARTDPLTAAVVLAIIGDQRTIPRNLNA